MRNPSAISSLNLARVNSCLEATYEESKYGHDGGVRQDVPVWKLPMRNPSLVVAYAFALVMSSLEATYEESKSHLHHIPSPFGNAFGSYL